LAALLILFGIENLQNAAADGDTRTLTMHHMHTGEDISITFKRNGRYDDEALQKLNKFLRDWRREESTRMDPHLLDLIWEVYQEVGGKQPIQIVCGYRSPQTNSMLRRRSSGVARLSQHTLGKAIVFYIPEVALAKPHAGCACSAAASAYPTSGRPSSISTPALRHWPHVSATNWPACSRTANGIRTIRLCRLERQGSAGSADGDEQPAVGGGQRADPAPVRLRRGRDEERLPALRRAPASRHAAARPLGGTGRQSEPPEQAPAASRACRAVPRRRYARPVRARRRRPHSRPRPNTCSRQ
jgi:uncharacterized protein YcbK (DUF882 family)